MMGFVSALSSSIALIVLIMIAQLINIMNITSQQDRAGALFVKSNENLQDFTQGTNQKNSNETSYFLTPDVVSAIGKHIDYILYCEYGDNLDLSTAGKILSYNYLALKKGYPEANITIKKPVLSTDKKNLCKILYED
ncbi:hypothetical protein DP590_07520 [Salmonella enterica]|nr:hypothetical protein [Salmonella enterica]ECE0742002.1 hypothetical protein [Salmonella enterica subsp. enterica serovar Hvittingfoss]HEC8062480.1 hypothetical protein [Salmonella enterica subsp. enterica serovar Potsdam]EGA8118245.1 hypothetical protein [Salmonella enterica]EHO8673524.1 hypothetical protein [Salmonella enterica]